MRISDCSYKTKWQNKNRYTDTLSDWFMCHCFPNDMKNAWPSFKNAMCDNAVYTMGVSIKRRHVTGSLHHVRFDYES